MSNLLEIKDLEVQYKTDHGVVYAVNKISLELKKGETLGLVGETGAGKTTTALSVMRLIPSPPGTIAGGEIRLEDRDILKIPEAEMRKIRGNKVSMIFQDPMTALNPVQTVGDQIAEVIGLHQKVSPVEAMKRACEMLETVGIPADRCKEYPHQFSGGMKQRVVIAIALACNPELLIADEPTTALDVTIQAQVMELMEQLKENFGTSMILITHDLGVVAEICDSVAIMYAGEIVEKGTLTDVFDRTLHPYTQGLFDSLPSLEKDVHRLKPIDGMMPDPTDLPEGCSFSPRCPFRTKECETADPKLLEHEPGHYVKCHRFLRESVR